MRALGLRAKIIGTSLLTLTGVLIALAAYDARTDVVLVQESRRAAQDLTKAMEVSVQQLGRSWQPDEDLLEDYVNRLGRTGIRQIIVLNPDKRPLVWSRTPHAFLIEEQPEAKDAPSTWDLLVPIVIGANKLGYVELKMTSQRFEDLLAVIRRQRTAFTALAFAAGIVLAWWLASQVARPVEALRVAAQRVARGDLDVSLPRAPGDEVGQLVRSFSEMVEGLKERKKLELDLAAAERDALLGRMAATIAHDVRNPLNYLSLAIDHLVATAATPDAEQIGAQMKRELARANQRIADFLRLGKPVEIHPRPIAVAALLEAVAASHATPEHPVTVEAEGAGEATWDPSVVEGILRNLVTNAIQASENADPVVLTAERDGEDVLIHVDDRGVGLTDEALARVFEPWFTTKADGVGLGLALARRAAEEHGGSLRAARRDGGGARFTLRLPRIAAGSALH